MRVKEILSYSDFVIEKQEPSLICAGKFITKTTGLRCPKCSNILGPLEHSESSLCRKCGLKMTRFGSVLECELEVPEKCPAK